VTSGGKLGFGFIYVSSSWSSGQSGSPIDDITLGNDRAASCRPNFCAVPMPVGWSRIADYFLSFLQVPLFYIIFWTLSLAHALLLGRGLRCYTLSFFLEPLPFANSIIKKYSHH
jgi:hypothetical protein